MRSIRKNTFETNSSSMHTISICDESCGYNTCIDNGQDYEGTLHVDLDRYGWEWKWIKTPYEKLQYVLTQIAQTLNCIEDYLSEYDDRDEAREEIYQSYDFKVVLYYIKKNTPFDNIEIGNLDGYIEHSSYVNTLYELCDEANCDNIGDFIFNSSIKIRQGNNNEWDPGEDEDEFNFISEDALDNNSDDEDKEKQCEYCKDLTLTELPVRSNCDLLEERFLTLIANDGEDGKEIVIHHKDKAFGIQINYCPICGRKLK